jgi:CheY-like chemotaxis protein
MHLEDAGYEVICAAGGGEAAKIINSRRFDLMLTDLLMPDRDGVEVIRGLRKDFPKLPIVAMTGGGLLSAEMYLNIAKGLHVDGVLSKPFSMESLTSLVQRLIEGKSPQANS